MDIKCKINHTVEDVKAKYQDQKEHLSVDLQILLEEFFLGVHTQNILNEVFHLLKKYDLSTDEEKVHRNNRLLMVLSNL